MKVTGTSLSMTRGDSETITVSCPQRPFTAGDVIEMTVRKRPEDTDVAMHKTVTAFSSGTAIIVINPSDTAALKFGRYFYDIQLKTSGGNVATLIKPSGFTLEKEVTYG